MSITLRAEKQQPLSFEELDKNFCSFYFSSSLFTDNQDNNYLRLWYTGSTEVGNPGEFNPRYDQYPLGGSSTGESTPTLAAGSTNQIQYNGGQGAFAASSTFVKTAIGVGINKVEPTETLHINSTSTKDSVVRLNCRATNQNFNIQSSKAYLQITQGESEITTIGKLYTDSNDTFIHTKEVPSTVRKGEKVFPAIRFNNGQPNDAEAISTLTIRNNNVGVKHNNPNVALSVVGEVGIGTSSNTNTNQSLLSGLTQYNFNTLVNNKYNQSITILPPETGGNVGVGLLNNLKLGATSFVIGSSDNSRDFNTAASRKVFEVSANGTTSISDILKINPIKSLPRTGEKGMIVMLDDNETKTATPYYYSGIKWVNMLTGAAVQ